MSMLTNVELPKDGDVMLHSDQYLQIGCDLRDMQLLKTSVTRALDVEQCLVLLVAEVSITYMDSIYSDEVIRWASTLPSGERLSLVLWPFQADE
jgi:tRNA wybutosine-synthesizing protein 4